MKKLFFVILIAFCSLSLYSQHRVGDVDHHGGWYKVVIDISNKGGTAYTISQCYPSGAIFDVIGTEREKLPLILKIFCMALVEEYIADAFDMEDLSFDEEGIFLEITNFSLSFNFKFSRSEAELLDELGPDIVNEYRNRRWP